eukprot:6209818-Pleurochrysis_carterae.AAC.2
MFRAHAGEACVQAFPFKQMRAYQPCHGACLANNPSSNSSALNVNTSITQESRPALLLLGSRVAAATRWLWTYECANPEQVPRCRPRRRWMRCCARTNTTRTAAAVARDDDSVSGQHARACFVCAFIAIQRSEYYTLMMGMRLAHQTMKKFEI